MQEAKDKTDEYYALIIANREKIEDQKNQTAEMHERYEAMLSDADQKMQSLQTLLAAERSKLEDQLKKEERKKEELEALLAAERLQSEVQRDQLNVEQSQYRAEMGTLQQKIEELQSLLNSYAKVEAEAKNERQQKEELEALLMAERNDSMDRTALLIAENDLFRDRIIEEQYKLAALQSQHEEHVQNLLQDHKAQYNLYEQRGQSLQGALREAKQRATQRIADLKKDREELVQKLTESHSIQASLEEDLFFEKVAALMQSTGLYQELNALKKREGGLAERYENELNELKKQLSEKTPEST